MRNWWWYYFPFIFRSLLFASVIATTVWIGYKTSIPLAVVSSLVGLCAFHFVAEWAVRIFTPSPTSGKDEKAIWPFATRKAYQKAKEANGARIQAIVENLSRLRK